MASILGFSALAVASCGANLHELGDEGMVYRSGQLPATNDIVIRDGEEHQISTLTLQEIIDTHDIQTIINLRGERPGEDWYDDEVDIADQMGVDLYSVRFSATRLPTREGLNQVFQIFDTASYPMLIHCKAGADRTGLISVLYKMEYEGEPLDEALEQLSFFPYLHLPIGPTTAIDKFFERFRDYSERGGTGSIRYWIGNVYNQNPPAQLGLIN